jgi:penicillin-binding protein 1A
MQRNYRPIFRTYNPPEVVFLTKRKNQRRRSKGGAAKVFKWIGIVLGTLLLGIFLTCLFVAGYAHTYVNDVIMPQAESAQTTLNSQGWNSAQSSSIVYTDKLTGQDVLMKTLYADENRVWVEYSDIPQNLINATVAIEDKRFWSHSGVDWKRTLGSAVYMFTGQSVQGGSTITQQLIKNLSQNDDVTVRRKVLEIFTALEFEKSHSKEEIIEMYLNNIYLGRQCNGVYTAAKKYFDKDVSDLTLSECACLISITNNPSLYDPYNHPENNRKRASAVLKQMYLQGYITEEEEISAMAEIGYLPDGGTDSDGNQVFTYHEDQVTLNFVQKDTTQEEEAGTTANGLNSWYTDAVISAVQNDLMETYGYTREAASNVLYQGGLTIHTCYDPDAQAIVDSVYENASVLDGCESKKGQELMSAISLVDNETGAVIALGQTGEKTVNRGTVYATDAKRQPGSSIKPLSVYAPALEEKLITPYSAVDDTPFRIDSDGNAYPKNSSRSYSGLTDITTAVKKSLNTAAVKTLDLVGLQTSYEYLTDVFGFSSIVDYMVVANGEVKSDIDYSPLALGGLTTGVTTFEMAGAYSTFPRNGVYIKPHLYTTVTDSDGNVILSNDETGTAALSENTAYYMNQMLEAVVTDGTGTKAQIPGYTVAGKTGTTNSNYDRWFCGYTSYYTAAVWIGYEYSESIQASGNPAVNLWQQVMSQMMQGKTDKSLTSTTKNVVSATYCTKSGDLATSDCSAAGCAATGYFIEGDAPTSYCTRHTSVTVCKDDPIGNTGMYHLAGQYCPEESKMSMAVLDFHRDEAASSVTVGDTYQMLSWVEAQGTCSVHDAGWEDRVELMKTQTVSVTSGFTKAVGDAPFALNASSEDGAGNAGGELSYQSSNPNVATVDEDGTVTIVGQGTATITVTAAATEYAPEVSTTTTITVKAGEGQSPSDND